MSSIFVVYNFQLRVGYERGKLINEENSSP